MKKIIKIVSFFAFCILPSALYAVCPVCTVAVGAGLEGARLLGVDDAITGIWAGALTLSMFFWTVGWLKKRGCKNAFWCIIAPFVMFYGLLGCVYLMPNIWFGQNTLWGIDKFLLGIVVGTLVFYLGERWSFRIKQDNGGKVRFPFQKVVIPLVCLLAATGVLYLIIK